MFVFISILEYRFCLYQNFQIWNVTGSLWGPGSKMIFLSDPKYEHYKKVNYILKVMPLTIE